MVRVLLLLIAAGAHLPTMAAGGDISGEVVRQPVNPMAIGMFLVFVALTLAITWRASKSTKTSASFYNAGGEITGLQNGAAIAGDFMSAASFLGITGLIFLGGFDGVILSIGAFAAWPFMLFLFAKRVRNLGSYTFVDVVSERLDRDRIRIVAVFGTITVVVMYLIAQMVGAGKLIQLLFGLPYELAVVIVSALVLAYVAFGGMLATTWVQIIKAILLLTGVTLMAILILVQSDFSFDTLLRMAGDSHPRGEAILAPGVLFDDPVQIVTIQVSMLFGILGLPHILMRLFTVPDMHQAKLSAFYASLLIGYFYILLLVIGFGAAALLYNNPEFFGIGGEIIGGSNMASIHLATALGGDILTGFMSAVTFATILAVVAGLTVSGAAAISHDLYAEVLKQGKPDPVTELRITRITVFVIGIVAVLLGIAFEDENVAFVATMPMVVAASVNFPILFLSLFWRGLTTQGAIAGALVGLVSSIVLIVLGPQVWVSVLDHEAALFPYNYPALFTLPLALLVTWVVSKADNSERGVIDKQNYDDLLIRSELGET
ncbi:acetate permease [Luminiphilus syltensis NOR5-1B]|uniref:Acetate permease n=1 Tax=Luminiphilus syltensis NOR5-1B TaxID=565045 RepID=B8KT76_9GAMM|nr:sodium/solute symporter [Luminiphilus syltensis]EED34365.1 acetate permease [Luminiphilus syltensis NOR5-1B]